MNFDINALPTYYMTKQQPILALLYKRSDKNDELRFTSYIKLANIIDINYSIVKL